jgi:hypothetical protein
MGESGTGKTHVLRTWIKAGITPFVIFTEPGMETLSDLPKGSWHWKYIAPGVEKWDALLGMATKVNMMDFDALTKTADPNKRQYTQFLDFIKTCNDFQAEDGKSYGDVMTWNTDRVLVIDSLSGLSDMAMHLVTGGKFVRAMQDWMIAQNAIEALLNQIVTGTKCWVTLTAHIEREKDEVTGGTSVMVSTLGRKLAPRLPRYFSDVIQTVREDVKFTWSTSGYGVAVKARNLPIKAGILPDFAPLVQSWKDRGGLILPTV